MTALTPDRPDLTRDQFTNDESYYLATGRRVTLTLTLTPEQMRELADQVDGYSWGDEPEVATVLRAAADQLEAVQAKLIRLENMIGGQMTYSVLRSELLDVIAAETAPQEDRDD